MKFNKTVVIAMVLFGLLVGGLGAAVLLSQRAHLVYAAPPTQQDTSCVDDDVGEDVEAEDADEEETCETDDADEASDVDEAGDVEDYDGDEANISPDQARITADEAKAAAEEASSGAKALAVELERENGDAIYEVELDNGLEVLVDAANGDVLGVEQDDTD